MLRPYDVVGVPDYYGYVMLVATVFVLLIIMTYLDVKHKKVPSILSTSIILSLLIFRYEYLVYGVMAFVFGWFLYESNYFRGVADLKALTIIGLMLHNRFEFGLLMGILVIVGFLYQLCFFYFKKRDKKEIPFLPVFLITYLILMSIKLATM